MELHDLVKACQKHDRKAQKDLYDRYAPLFLSMTRRYFSNQAEAEDAMIEAFYTIFNKINKFLGDGSFEGWMKKIVVNTCLMELRKKKVQYAELDSAVQKESPNPAPDQTLFEKDILKLLDKLPDGYRTIFNLYAIEGYKHREIAKMLDISINTSKSQLIQARKRLAEFIEDQQQLNYERR